MPSMMQTIGLDADPTAGSSWEDVKSRLLGRA